MGINCSKSQQDMNNSNTGSIGNILKIDNLSSSDIAFWSDMKETKMIVIDKITKHSIEFKQDSLQLENIVSFDQCLAQLMRDHNLFFFVPIFEIMLGLMDFIEIVLKIKEKYKKDFFFLIDFEKFYLERDDQDNFSHLVYLDNKLNEPFDLPDIAVNDDQGFFNSITGSIGDGKLLSALNHRQEGEDLNRSTEPLDVNKYFYSGTTRQYQQIRDNFSFEECDNLYANCFLHFIHTVLFKKVEVNISEFDSSYQNLKKIVRYVFAQKYIENQVGKLTLRKLKMVLTNFYINNQEFLQFKSSLDSIVDPNQHDNYALSITNAIHLKINRTDADFVLQKAQEFAQSNIRIMYGKCTYTKEDLIFHNCQYYSETWSKSQSNGLKICIHCLQLLLTKFFEDKNNATDYGSVKEFEESFIQAYPFLKDNINDVLEYCCIAFNNNIQGDMKNIDKSKIKIYRKNEMIIFDLNDININNSDQFFIDDIINIDFKAKNSINALKTKKTFSKK